MPILSILFVMGLVLVGFVAFAVIMAAVYRAFREPSEAMPDATEHEPDDAEYVEFMAERPTVEEIRRRAIDQPFDEKVALYRNIENDNKGVEN